MGGEAWLHVYIFLKASHATFRVADARIFYVDAKQEPFSLTRNLTSQGFSYEKPSGLTREKKKEGRHPVNLSTTEAAAKASPNSASTVAEELVRDHCSGSSSPIKG